jgi:hypothetical protein
MLMDASQQNWRKGLLYLGLAAMECCWFYPWHLLVLGAGGRDMHIPPLAVLGIVLLGLALTRFLQDRTTLLAQRVVTILLALLSACSMLYCYVYSGYGWTSLLWLRRFIWEAGDIMQGIRPSLLVFFSVLYLWWRGVRIAQQDLGVEAIGFGFRLGIIAFVWFFMVRIFSSAPDATGYAFLYFLIGLPVLGLARIEAISRNEVGIRTTFGASWMGILAGSALAVSMLSIAIANLFSLRNIRSFLALLRPLVDLLGRLTYPLQAALAWLLQLILTALISLFSGLFGTSEQDLTAFEPLLEQLRQFQQLQPTGPLPVLFQFIKWAALGLVFVCAMLLLGLSIGRVQQALQQGRDAEHGSAWDRDDTIRELGDAAQERWRRFRERWLERLGRLRGEAYSLASVRKTYASLVRLATATGYPRRDAQTPFEYTATLQIAFPGCETEIQLITEAYVRAHYGARAFGPRYVQRVREAWLKIRERQQQSRAQESAPLHAN